MPTNVVQTPKTKNGMGLLDFVNCKDEEQAPTRPWVPGQDPEWRKLKDGLNLKGICPNDKTPCGGQAVWVPLGYSKNDVPFHMNREIPLAVCIACKAGLSEVVNVNLINCHVQLDGMDENKNRVIEEKTAREGNFSLTFKEDEGRNIIAWRFLCMKVTRIPPPAESNGGIPFFKWIASWFQ